MYSEKACRLLVLPFACAVVLLSACSGRLKVGPGWEGEEVVGEGVVPYDAKDVPGTEAAALAAAQRSAVEQVVGVFVSGQTQVQAAVTIQQKILSRTQGLVRRYKIVQKERDGDFFKMKIKAFVLVQNVGDLINDLNLASKPKINAKALVIVDETVENGQSETGGSARQGVLRGLSKTSLTVIENPSAQPNEAGAKDEDLAALGRNSGVGIVIAGSARVYKMQNLTQLGEGFSSYRASVSLKAVVANTGQVLAAATREAAGIDPTEGIAAQKALSSAGELAGQNIIKPLEDALSSGMSVVLRITGMTDIGDLKKIQDILRTVPEVQDVALNNYSKGDAELSVTVRGIGGEELVASILRAKPFPLEPETVSQFEARLKVIR